MTRHQAKARNAAWSLAVVAIFMVFAAAAAVFAPSGNGKKTTSLPLRHGLGLFIHPPTYPPASQSASPSPSTPATQWPTPRSVVPVAYPLPARTYPAPVKTYPAPTPRTYPAPPPPPPPPPGADLPAPVALIPPLEGVVTTDVPAWNQATSTHAQLAVYYVSMARPLAPTFVHSAVRTAAGATPVIEITPTALGQPALSLEQIATGQADTWLTAMRQQIGTLGRPVVISFAPEPNGHWYAWGMDPAGFTAAWQHVHQVIGTTDVTWLWQVSAHNAGDPATDGIGAYWPGAGTVDWAGLDGYYYVPGDTFAHRFDASLTEVEGMWGGPVIIAETAVSPATNNMPNDITDLFAGVAARHLLGLIYFDLNVCPAGGCGTFKVNFQLETYPAALAAYVKAVNAPW